MKLRNTHKNRPPANWTEYQGLPEGERWEIIHGEAYDMSPSPMRRHQRAVVELSRQIGNHFKGQKCEAYVAPLDVKLDDVCVVQPDVFVVCDKRICHDTHINGAPDLIIEVLSPTSIHRDRFIKFGLYAQKGVSEYWIVDPDAQRVEVFVHHRGTYRLACAYEKNETARSVKFKALKVALSDVFDVSDESGGKLRLIKEPKSRYRTAAVLR
ncbi:MAG: Uma2 family endonuclease [bacterium]